jgi:hypothetical protein
MKTMMILLMGFFMALEVNAGCAKDYAGIVKCGPGQCLADYAGIVKCSTVLADYAGIVHCQ